MMMKSSLGFGLLCLSLNSYANIVVTTTDDMVKDDGMCSLREAVIYVNEYLDDATKKNAGYYGCGSSDATTLNNVIELKADTVYTLDSALELKKSMTLLTTPQTGVVDATAIGLHNATLVARGKHRLLTIDDTKSDISQINVNIRELNLQGCGVNQCEQQGGIIFNRESLNIQYTKLSSGSANLGGAIYNAGLVNGSNINSAGAVSISNSILQGNQADNGAALYTEQPLFQIKTSVIRDNQTLTAQGTVLYSAIAFDDATTTTDGFMRISYLINSTLFNNKGYIINLRDGVYANNITALNNTSGIYFDAPQAKAHLSNSILVNNGTDCQTSSNDRSSFYNNLVGDSCAAGEAANPNIYWSNVPHNKLIAGSAIESSQCDLPPSDGLLCPFVTPTDYFLGFFRPRLLTSYSTLSQSPIVNRGRLYSDGSSLGLFSCESNDQRGLSRGNTVQCDLGAIELSVSPSNITRIGQDLTYGQIAHLDLSNNLADGQLLPAADCPSALGRPTAPDGSAWTDGCLRVEQTNATPTSKGRLVLTSDGKLTYTPNSNWHGLDEFNLRIVTTASRFSDSISDRDIVIPVRIVQAPPDNFESKTVNVKGGATGIVGLIGLVGLALYRRRLRANPS